MKVISGSSNPSLASSIAQELGTELVKTEISEFANGERRVRIIDNIHGENICLVQSFSQPVNTNIIETILLVDALERMGIRHVNLVIPWLGYSLQDKVFLPGEPISTKVIANILSATYVKRVYLLDLHNSSIPGFFSVPTHHISAMELFAQYAKDNIDLNNAIVVSPDFGGLKRARDFAKLLGLSLCNIDKSRDLSTGQVTINSLQGDVQAKAVIMLDDVIMSGSTAIETAKIIKSAGAKSVHFFATHGVFTNNAVEKLAISELDQVIITDTISREQNIGKFTQLSVAKLFADQLKKWI